MKRFNLIISSRFSLSILVFVSALFMSCGGGHKGSSYSAIESYIEESLYNSDSVLDEDSNNYNTEEYDRIVEDDFESPIQHPISTFSIDVDTASYSNIRRFITDNQMPPKNSVRIEEMINYFNYSYPDPKGKHPFSVTTEIATCPWNSENRLALIGIQGRKPDYDSLKPSNFVFLVDSSGSMSDSNKLPLLKKSLAMLLDNLSENDHVAIVAYAGSAGLILDSTPATEKKKILRALNKLNAGGSTAGKEGIELAYNIAEDNLIEGGNNRVILATDGDFNVGVSSTGALVDMIVEKRKQNDIYLTIIGLGMGNLKDGRMEQISNYGDGNYFYIDSIREAEKVFVTEMRANLFTIAKDVKIQVEFNPNHVKGYRLLGYENRRMNAEDFDDDIKDAGELGAGHNVTALYEIIPADSKQEVKQAGKLKYQKTEQSGNFNNELMTVKLRYKPLNSDKSILLKFPVNNSSVDFKKASEDMRFASSVAAFGMILRDSEYKGKADYQMVNNIAKSAAGSESYERNEFLSLVNLASLLDED